MAICNRSTVLLCLLLVAPMVAAAKNATAAGGLHHYFYLDSCPQLETLVRSTVETALQKDVRITAGLLRIFFHDCFPQGCDASILLDNGERQLGPNLGLQQAALQLIEDIRAKVHAACGPTVSCADILALATRDAVNLAGGPTFTVNLGRKDSRAPASQNEVFTLPPPSFAADELLKAFSDKGLDNFDLVALSGAHTVGKARCSAFGNPSTPPRDDLGRCLAGICTASEPNRLRDLDFLTPEVFDNMYFTELFPLFHRRWKGSQGCQRRCRSWLRGGNASQAPVLTIEALSKDRMGSRSMEGLMPMAISTSMLLPQSNIIFLCSMSTILHLLGAPCFRFQWFH